MSSSINILQYIDIGLQSSKPRRESLGDIFASFSDALIDCWLRFAEWCGWHREMAQRGRVIRTPKASSRNGAFKAWIRVHFICQNLETCLIFWLCSLNFRGPNLYRSIQWYSMIILVGVYILRYLYIWMLCALHIVIALAWRCAIFRYSLYLLKMQQMVSTIQNSRQYCRSVHDYFRSFSCKGLAKAKWRNIVWVIIIYSWKRCDLLFHTVSVVMLNRAKLNNWRFCAKLCSYWIAPRLFSGLHLFELMEGLGVWQRWRFCQVSRKRQQRPGT